MRFGFEAMVFEKVNLLLGGLSWETQPFEFQWSMVPAEFNIFIL